MEFKVNTQKRQRDKIFIDFGPYPLSKHWQRPKGNESNENSSANRTDKTDMFLPPDEDNYEYHGIKNLVVKYSEFGTTLKLDPSVHQNSDFCTTNNI